VTDAAPKVSADREHAIYRNDFSQLVPVAAHLSLQWWAARILSMTEIGLWLRTWESEKF